MQARFSHQIGNGPLQFVGGLSPGSVPSLMLIRRDRPRVEVSAVAGVRIKVDRGYEITQQLSAEMKAYTARAPFEPVREDEPYGENVRVRLRVREQPNPRWGAMVGDIVHNLRSALDLLAWQLVLANGAEPGRHTYFPIGNTKSSFAAQLPNALRGAGPRAQRLTELLRPWRGGNSALWILDALNNEDKHRVLVPIVVSQAALGATYQGDTGAPDDTLTMWIHFGTAAPVTDGADLGTTRIPKPGEPLIGSKYLFHLAIGGPDLGLDLTPMDVTLQQLGLAVSQIVELYARNCFA